jgi:hypothetical protein
VYFDLFEQPTPASETINVTLRQLAVTPQAIDFRVDATMIQFSVFAQLVSSNNNALRRLHLFFEVEFTDGTTGDNGLAILGDITWPDEVVIFTDSGVEITLPFHWGDDEFVILTEDAFGVSWSINQSEFVTLADSAVRSILDFLASETFRFSDVSVGLTGVVNRAESVTVTDFGTVKGDVSDVATMAEFISLSETIGGANSIIFSDAVFMAEFWTRIFDFQIQPDSVVWLDAMVVSEVAATDSRPGAFIPGAALLGSPQ